MHPGVRTAMAEAVYLFSFSYITATSLFDKTLMVRPSRKNGLLYKLKLTFDCNMLHILDQVGIFLAIVLFHWLL